MYRSRPLQDLCCLTQATLFNACLTEADLRELGAWSDAPSRRGFSPAVWCRALLHRACREDEAVARRLTDLLDLQYLDTVVAVRSMPLSELEEMVDLWIAEPRGEALPGLLWSLCTDSREGAGALGARLCHEAATAAFQSLVGGGNTVSHTAPPSDSTRGTRRRA